MKRIQNETFIGANSQAVILSDSEQEGSAHPAWLGELLDICFDGYEQNHGALASRGKVLSMSETRLFNILAGTFRDVPLHEWIALEEQSFQLIKKLGLWVMPMLPCWRHGPALLDILDGQQEAVTASPNSRRPEVVAHGSAH
mgnify:CR=1 FL=1